MNTTEFIRLNRYRFIIILERLRGLDFTKQLDNQQTNVNKADGVYFSSSAYFPELKKVLTELNITSQDSILDYGSGKGASLLLFRKYAFGKVSGVELSPVLLDIARKNFKRLRVHDINMYHANGRDFQDLDQYNHFYFYNPFPCDVMDAVLNNIRVSIGRKPRTVKLIYCNPKCHQLIVDSGYFQELKRYEGQVDWGNIIVYQSS